MNTRFKPYWMIAKNNLLSSLVYRWNILSGLVLMLLQIVVSLFIWTQIIGDSTEIKGYTLSDMISYFLLSALVGVTFSSTHMFRLPRMIRTGSLNMLLIRPYSFLGDSLAYFIGSKLVEWVITIIVAALFIFYGLSSFPVMGITSTLLLVCNFILLFIFGSVIGCLGFWLIQMWPMKPLYNSLMAVLGGTLYPLDLLPSEWTRIITLTPFPLFGYVNTKILQGTLTIDEIFYYLTVSISWIVVLFIVYRLLWRAGLKTYEGVNA